MNFAAKYPDAKPGDQPEGGLLRVNRTERCTICREFTRFADIDFQCFICSDECYRVLIWDYNLVSLQSELYNLARRWGGQAKGEDGLEFATGFYSAGRRAALRQCATELADALNAFFPKTLEEKPKDPPKE